jgi:FkbM family methyltransferase
VSDASRSLAAIRASARLSDWLYRRAPPLYALLYNAYKRRAERREIAVIRSLVRPGQRVVEIGANIGFYRELLAASVGPHGRVYAFEPEERNFIRLAARARAYPQVTSVRAAVAATPGSIDLHLSAHLNVDHRTYGIDEARAITSVPAVSLDRYLTDSSEAIDFIKMDIQGAEYPALLGMREVVARSPRVSILMELWPFVYERYGQGTAALLALVESWGLTVHRLGTEPASLGPRVTAAALLPEQGDPNAYLDVLCVRGEQFSPIEKGG